MLFGGVIPAISGAQETDKLSTEYSVLDAVEPPVGDSTDAYRKTALREGARTKATYATDLKGDLTGEQAKEQPVKINPPRRSPAMDLNGFGVALAVALVVGALFLWLKFGGGGVLLAREPRDDTRRKHATPDSWKMGDGMVSDADGLLTQIAQMSDRTAAMVLLLRHCLLAAARATDARFARSDTERGAFRRLPEKWVYHDRLEHMLQHTELAHYGGRDVAEDRFAEALDTARSILNAAKSAGRANG